MYRYIHTHTLGHSYVTCNPFLKQFAYDCKGKGGDCMHLDIVIQIKPLVA